MNGERIRVMGTVQGVGFRPTVWRLAHELALGGSVRNDAEGVLIELWGAQRDIDRFADRLVEEQPPLSVIESLRRVPFETEVNADAAFRIVLSVDGQAATNVAADAATCPECLTDIRDPANRRYRYPFTNCTHCGPRLSITRAVPYDRVNTSMAAFALCAVCRAEYEDPADRRFHAQPNACPDCGPRAWLESAQGDRIDSGDGDALHVAAAHLRAGRIVAVKGLGGFHLACLATDAAAVQRLRQRKHRYQKALAMMSRDIAIVGRYAMLDDESVAALRSIQAPVVVLEKGATPLPDAIAPGQDTLGFMLPYTPLHHLLLEDIDVPVVMTSGNRSDEPQAIDNADARLRLAAIADVFLMHDRDIVNRLDDSVVCANSGDVQFMRRARGYAPQPIHLHESFAAGEPVLAMGGELKNTFCCLQQGRAVVSQHIGDMEDSAALHDYLHNLELYFSLYDFAPHGVAADAHPEYLPTKLAAQRYGDHDLQSVQHHHAHVASVMAEHGLPIGTPAVLGIVLDGLGLGDDGTFWGGEFLRADFAGYCRLGRFQPVAMPGGSAAMREPWRNLWAHLHAAFGWQLARTRFAALEPIDDLARRPVAVLEKMLERGVQCPLASSAGRLFDAVAAAVGICRDGIAHEAQAAMELETLARAAWDSERHNGYPVEQSDAEFVELGWRSLWQTLLDDERAGVPRSVIAARFHAGLVDALCGNADRMCRAHGLRTVVIGGGVFQNRILSQAVPAALSAMGYEVLAPRRLPANDGGLSLGQAAIAARRLADQSAGWGSDHSKHYNSSTKLLRCCFFGP